jgi:predicted CXXCH cytochrome family protein
MTRLQTSGWERLTGCAARLTLAAGLLLMVPAIAAGGEAAKGKMPAPDVDASLYVGSDTCKTCHEGIYKNFEATSHWKTTLKQHEGGAQGCEVCHGSGKAHIEGGGDKSKIFTFAGAEPGEISRRCLSCHEYGEEHANFDRSQHNVNSVSCTACHSAHHAKETQYLLVKPFRHRVDQGLIRCSDCHNQHGGFLTKSLRATAAQDQVCFKCHADKAGPFSFEHEPVKTEGCMACHSPHGSTNPRLLKRAQINLLCLECHTLTQDSGTPPIPSFHNQSQKYSACTLCHPTIHGSNFDAFFLK